MPRRLSNNGYMCARTHERIVHFHRFARAERELGGTARERSGAHGERAAGIVGSRGVEGAAAAGQEFRMNRVDRQYTRRPSLVSVRRRDRAAGLVESAGRAERGGLDVLERRQLLFALTVTANDVDPNTGLGTVTAYFGYVPQRMGLLQQLQDQ